MTQLKRSITLPYLMFYGLGTMVGAGFYALLGKVVGEVGMAAPLAFLLTGILAMLSAISFAELSSRFPLAGGESLLSLACIVYLSYLAGGMQVVIIAVAAIGGLLGFLRFNTHPAHIFMGDGGSQFLGLTLGFLAVQLTQDVNPVLTMTVRQQERAPADVVR